MGVIVGNAWQDLYEKLNSSNSRYWDLAGLIYEYFSVSWEARFGPRRFETACQRRLSELVARMVRVCTQELPLDGVQIQDDQKESFRDFLTEWLHGDELPDVGEDSLYAREIILNGFPDGYRLAEALKASYRRWRYKFRSFPSRQQPIQEGDGGVLNPEDDQTESKETEGNPARDLCVRVARRMKELEMRNPVLYECYEVLLWNRHDWLSNDKNYMINQLARLFNKSRSQIYRYLDRILDVIWDEFGLRSGLVIRKDRDRQAVFFYLRLLVCVYEPERQ
jgi:hypothetical protein